MGNCFLAAIRKNRLFLRTPIRKKMKAICQLEKPVPKRNEKVLSKDEPVRFWKMFHTMHYGWRNKSHEKNLDFTF